MKDLFIGLGSAGRQMIAYLKDNLKGYDFTCIDIRNEKNEEYLLNCKRIFLFVGLSGYHSLEAIMHAEKIKGSDKILVVVGSLPIYWEGANRINRANSAKERLSFLADNSFFPDNNILYLRLPKEGPANDLYNPAMEEILRFIKNLSNIQ